MIWNLILIHKIDLTVNVFIALKKRVLVKISASVIYQFNSWIILNIVQKKIYCWDCKTIDNQKRLSFTLKTLDTTTRLTLSKKIAL